MIDDAVVLRLWAEIRSRRDEAIAYLQASRDADSAVISPNLRVNDQQSTVVTCHTEERPESRSPVCSAVSGQQVSVEVESHGHLADAKRLDEELGQMYLSRLMSIAEQDPDDHYRWVSRHRPDLRERIDTAENELTRVWLQCLSGQATKDDFRQALDYWERSRRQALDAQVRQMRPVGRQLALLD
ncbi:MAG: hypothetical protein QXI61_06455 [Nitrososphaerota archaeon]